MIWNTIYKPHGRVAEHATTKPSMTVPNEAMSIQEIMRRHSKGLPLGGNNAQYDDTEDGDIDFDDFMPNLQTMDLADRAEYLAAAKLHLEDVKKKLNALASAREQQRKDRQKQEAEDKAELKRIREARQKASSTPAPSAGGDQ